MNTIATLSPLAFRTQSILDYFKGHQHEFQMLKGLLIASHGMTRADQKVIENAYDSLMIAARMDEIMAMPKAKADALGAT
jgi:hypothetical protein